MTTPTPNAAYAASHEVTAKRRMHGNGWLWACSCGLQGDGFRNQREALQHSRAHQKPDPGASS